MEQHTSTLTSLGCSTDFDEAVSRLRGHQLNPPEQQFVRYHQRQPPITYPHIYTLAYAPVEVHPQITFFR